EGDIPGVVAVRDRRRVIAKTMYLAVCAGRFSVHNILAFVRVSERTSPVPSCPRAGLPTCEEQRFHVSRAAPAWWVSFCRGDRFSGVDCHSRLVIICVLVTPASVTPASVTPVLRPRSSSRAHVLS